MNASPLLPPAPTVPAPWEEPAPAGIPTGASASRLSPALRAFLAEQAPRRALDTPFVVVDVDVVRARYRELSALFPGAAIQYAVKANPHPRVLSALRNLGAAFDVASGPEVETCLDLGVPAARLSFGNTVKRPQDVIRAHAAGVGTYTVDSDMELEKVAAHAPGAGVVVRLLTSGVSAQWPLSRKFGCDPAMAAELLERAPRLGLRPLGVCFHVGSQQLDPRAWDGPLRTSALLLRRLARRGIHLSVLNLGGGFPARYDVAPPPLAAYATEIHASLRRHFGAQGPQVVLEPGRSLVADAGVLEAEVLLVARKSRHDPLRWVFLDIGKFGGLAETMDECIHYALECSRGGPAGPVVLAGPTCDSADILYERRRCELPLDLAAGDRVRFHAAGAYTSTYASVGFNGFAPLRTHVVEGRP